MSACGITADVTLTPRVSIRQEPSAVSAMMASTAMASSVSVRVVGEEKHNPRAIKYQALKPCKHVSEKSVVVQRNFKYM